MRIEKIQMTFKQVEMQPEGVVDLQQLTVETNKGTVCLTEDGTRGDVSSAVKKFLEGINEAVLAKLVERLPSE